MPKYGLWAPAGEPLQVLPWKDEKKLHSLLIIYAWSEPFLNLFFFLVFVLPH